MHIDPAGMALPGLGRGHTVGLAQGLGQQPLKAQIAQFKTGRPQRAQ